MNNSMNKKIKYIVVFILILFCVIPKYEYAAIDVNYLTDENKEKYKITQVTNSQYKQIFNNYTRQSGENLQGFCIAGNQYVFATYIGNHCWLHYVNVSNPSNVVDTTDLGETRKV